MTIEDDDRRVETARTIGVMAEQIRNLSLSMGRVEEGQRALLVRIEESDRRGEQTCRTCGTWARLTNLETLTAAHTVSMEVVRDHEQRLRYIEPKLYGAAAVISCLVWLAGKYL